MTTPSLLPCQLVQQKNRIEVCQYDMNGQLLKVWEGSRRAAETLGLDNSNIVKCCKGKYISHGGYIWRNVGDAFDKYPLPKPKKEKIVKVKQPTSYDASVDQYDQEGNLIATYQSMYEAEHNAPTTKARILKCCNGKLVTSGKCIWRYNGEPFDKYPTKVERNTAADTKERLRQRNLNSEYTKSVSQPVGMYNDDWELIKIYPSTSQAVKDKGQGVIKVLRGEQIHCKGYRWKLIH